jgi:hypothetical protein
MATAERRSSSETGSGGGGVSPAGGEQSQAETVHESTIRAAEMNGEWSRELKPKRVVFPMAGKGGVGKTTVVATLAEWYASNGFKVAIFDMDPDNKAEGSLFSFFPNALKLPALESWTYDRLLGVSLDSDADVILADMGAAQGHRMIPWFRDFYRVMQDSGIALRWTAIGVVDADIASARSVLDWAEALQDGVDYLIVHNHHRDDVASAWESPGIVESVSAFRKAFAPMEIRMDARRPDLQRFMRIGCATLTAVGERRANIAELKAPDMMLRARTYRFRAFNEFATVQRILLP